MQNQVQWCKSVLKRPIVRILLALLSLANSGCLTFNPKHPKLPSERDADPLFALSNSEEWSGFLPKNMFVRRPELYRNIQTRIRSSHGTIRCEVGACARLLNSDGEYRVDRFGFRSTAVIENEYPVYSVRYSVRSGMRQVARVSTGVRGKTGIGQFPIVAFVGDSNTWGEGHDFADTFVGILERQFPDSSFRNFSMCPFQEECRLPSRLNLNPIGHELQGARTLLLVPIFASTTKSNELNAIALVRDANAAGGSITALLVDFRAIKFGEITRDRHLDFPTGLLSKLGHALVARVLADKISAEANQAADL